MAQQVKFMYESPYLLGPPGGAGTWSLWLLDDTCWCKRECSSLDDGIAQAQQTAITDDLLIINLDYI